jgi:hypothetical protein
LVVNAVRAALGAETVRAKLAASNGLAHGFDGDVKTLGDGF